MSSQSRFCALRNKILLVILLLLTTAMPLGAQAAEVAAPLGKKDITLYEEIFTIQENGKWAQADQLLTQIENPILFGHVYYQRYMHPTAYRSSYDELRRWLSTYYNHPDADVIYKLAKKRRPSGARPPVRPQSRRWRTNDDQTQNLHPQLVVDYENANNLREVKRIENYVRHLNKNDRPTQALNYINGWKQRRHLSEAQYDRIRSWIAASYYYNHKRNKALSIAESVATSNGDSAVLSYWIAGLNHWRDGNHQQAEKYFSKMVAVPYQEDELRAAAGFWTARAALVNGNLGNIVPSLEIAATFPFTFYGQLAIEQLGQDTTINWQPPTLSEQEWQTLASKSPRTVRAAALSQIGQYEKAQEELRWAHGELEDKDDAALMAVAFERGLWAAQVTMAIASDAYADEQRLIQAGLYPVPDFTPNGGFELDRAILFGLIRQESKFMTEARSRVGAVGLMQLMPRTASFVAGDRTLQYRSGRTRLAEPGYNMQLGQSYVQELLTRYTDGDMFEMALAYNWGPGNLRRFKKKTDITDQLLLLESVPNPEARDFVEHVMTNIWIYRDRLGQEAPTRAAAAAGGKPIYQSID